MATPVALVARHVTARVRVPPHGTVQAPQASAWNAYDTHGFVPHAREEAGGAPEAKHWVLESTVVPSAEDTHATVRVAVPPPHDAEHALQSEVTSHEAPLTGHDSAVHGRLSVSGAAAVTPHADSGYTALDTEPVQVAVRVCVPSDPQAARHWV